jgi:hypothetical protein
LIEAARIPELLGLLTSPVTRFDCGTLCAPGNGGVPVCCHAQSIIPVLYKAELAYFRKRTRLWRRYVPQSRRERERNGDLRACDILAVCKGAAHCARDNRSLGCRTFPFEPYVDHDGRLAGLVFNYDFTGMCPLVGDPSPILPAFIEQCLALWRRIFELEDEERQFFAGASQSLRRSFAQKRLPIPVFTREGVRWMATSRAPRPGRRAAAGG